jgi:hypothetical protein
MEVRDEALGVTPVTTPFFLPVGLWRLVEGCHSVGN